MARIYLVPGTQFRLNYAAVRVGATGTCVDLQLSLQNLDGNEGVGQIHALGYYFSDEVMEEKLELNFTVFLEETTGRLYYEDDNGR